MLKIIKQTLFKSVHYCIQSTDTKLSALSGHKSIMPIYWVYGFELQILICRIYLLMCKIIDRVNASIMGEMLSLHYVAVTPNRRY